MKLIIPLASTRALFRARAQSSTQASLAAGTHSSCLHRQTLGCCIAAIALLATPLPAPAAALTEQQQAGLLAEAIQAADRGADLRQSDSTAAAAAFREAATKFQALVDAGLHNGRLYYDLGNAYLECGHIGRAIASYRCAERLIPDDARLEHNLRYARSLRRNQLETAGGQAFVRTLFFWHYDTSLMTRFIAGLAAYVAFWLVLLARTAFPRLSWRYAAMPLLAIWLALGVSVSYEWWTRGHRLEGVIVTDDVVVRKGSGDGFEPQFAQKLHEGVEFRVLEQHRGWLHVELPDANTGWIRADQAELL